MSDQSRRRDKTALCQQVVVGALLTAILACWCARADAAILSSKRGFADTGAGYSNLQATGAGWYYTWGLGAANPGSFDASFAPMFWGGWAVNQNNINAVKNNANVEWVLGFNEPERTDQANMSVGAAISSWTTLSNGFAGSGKKLVSPAVSDTGEGQAWISSFMNQANSAGLQVDAVAFHWYGVSNPNNPAGAASSFLSRVDWYHNLANKPVFITEFAIHDWGGSYSDEEISEANRQFLDIVIPALESRSYVAGYSWYHWFSDAHLYEGSPPAPTPMGYEYIGVLQSGDYEDAGGQDYGEHVAYLAGGELAMNGRDAGALRYVNALEGTSVVSGATDWSISRGGWIRVQPGATLRKTGSNQLGVLAGSLTNDGVLEVAQGTLQVGVTVAGGGDVVVRGGTLALVGRGELAAPLIDVRSSGTIDASTVASPLAITGGHTLQLAAGGAVLGSVTGTSGSLIAGGGAITGNVNLLTGATLRVGNGGTAVATRYLIDDFQGYATGNVRDVASPPWTAHQDTGFADIESDGGSQVLSYGWSSDFRGVSRTLADDAVLEDDGVGTYFFRINSKTDAPNHNVGVGDQATTSGVDFGDFEAQVRLKQDATAGTFALDARNGGSFTTTLANGLATNTWYNVWLVVDQAADTYDVYLGSGTGDATAGNKLNATPLSFRNGTAADLNTILGLAGSSPVDNAVRVDDLYFFTGVDLTNPLGGFDSGAIWNAETMTVDGDYVQAAGAMLQLNLFDPNRHDTLVVTGNAALAGDLEVSLADDAPTPQAGDVFDILNLGSVSGAFDGLMLPALATGLAWDVSDLLASGTLAVIEMRPGDFNLDGEVDGADLLAWQRGASPNPGSSSDLADWQQSYGTQPLPPRTAAVPEPTTLALGLGLVAVLGAAARFGRRGR